MGFTAAFLLFLWCQMWAGEEKERTVRADLSGQTSVVRRCGDLKPRVLGSPSKATLGGLVKTFWRGLQALKYHFNEICPDCIILNCSPTLASMHTNKKSKSYQGEGPLLRSQRGVVADVLVPKPWAGSKIQQT